MNTTTQNQPAPAPCRPHATNGARALRAKLEALTAAPGTPDEGAAAARKLARLLAKYNFDQADISKDDLFKGKFRPARSAVPVARLDDFALASNIKWAIEHATGINCRFNGPELMAEADPRSAAKLAKIADTIADGFRQLWTQFASAPGIVPADRPLFLMGLYDGMMNETRTAGQALPQRAPAARKAPRASRRAVGHVAGLNLHPYQVAAALGRQIRFSVPLPDIANQLTATIAGTLPASN